MKTNLMKSLVGFVFLFASAFAVPAQVIDDYTITNTSGWSLYGDNVYVLGYDFTPNKAITVTSLGILDWSGNGLEAPSQIGIWDNNGSLVVSATLPAGTFNAEPAGAPGTVFYITNIVPVTLSSGITYRIGNQMFGDNMPVVGWGGKFVAAGDIRFGIGWGNLGTAFTEPLGFTNATPYMGPVFQYQLPPTITIQPQSQTVPVGANVFLSVSVTGSTPLYYQWHFNAIDLLAATNASLTLSNIQPAEVGAYSVTLSNPAAVLLSSNATLTLLYPSPFVIWIPTNLTVFAGASASFSETVLTYSPTSYQWYFNGAPMVDDGRITGSTTTNLNIANVQTSDVGSYSLIATNDTGRAGGATATLKVLPLTTVAIQPQNLITNGAATVGFSSSVAGQQPFTYQWQFNGTNLNGATNNNLTLTNLLDQQSGAYCLRVGNAAGTIASSNSVLSVIPWVAATIQPATIIASSGSGVFSFTEGGFSTNTSYQWQLNGTNLGSAWEVTNNEAIDYNPVMADAGIYDVVATDSYAMAVSSNIVLTVIPLAITTQPQSQAANGGQTVNLHVVVGGQLPIVYQWLYNGSNIDGATNNLLTLNNVQLSQSGNYSVIVSNAFAMVTSSSAILSVSALAVAQLTNQVAWPNSSVTFKVTASGTPPFSYDWRCNGIDVPGANSSALVLSNLLSSQFGLYSVIVSNAFGSVLSSNATLYLSQVVVWGYDQYRELALPTGLTNVLAIAGGMGGSSDCYAIKNNGQFYGWPDSPTTFPISNVVAIAGGGSLPLQLKTNGTVALVSLAGSPVISGLTNIVAIAADFFGPLALQSNGMVAGSASTTGLTNVVAIAEGYQHGLALKANGTVVAWGNNTYGQATVPTLLSNITAIAAGYFHSLALKGDGTVVAWGYNAYGQTNIPSGLSNVIAIAAGYDYNLALKADGTVMAWGHNYYGQTNVPFGLSNVVAIAAGEYLGMALIGNEPPVTQVPLSNPVTGTNIFSIALPTMSGKVYALQYKNSMTDTNWTSFPLMAGNGGKLILTDPAATNSQRFYRVQQW